MMQTSKNTNVCLFDISWRWNLTCIKRVPNLENQRRRGWAHWLHLHCKYAIGNGGRNGSHRHDGSAAADHHPQTIAIRAAVFSCFALELLWIRNACPAITCFKKSATQWPWKYAKSWLPGALWHGYYLKNHTGKKWLGGPWSPFLSISHVEWISHVDW